MNYSVRRHLKIPNDKTLRLPPAYDNIWFTSDWHLDHARIIQLCNRPFANVLEMNEKLVENYNSKVGDKDLVYFLGDVGIGKPEKILSYVKRLKGNKILVRGNHEDTELYEFSRTAWLDVVSLEEIRVTRNSKGVSEAVGEFSLCHYPFAVWNKSHYGSINLHGHSHGNFSPCSQQYDVGVDPNGYFPISIVEVMDKLSTLPPLFYRDHHK